MKIDIKALKDYSIEDKIIESNRVIYRKLRDII
jgi:hypothetical protein